MRLGFKNIEIFINTFSELEEPFLKRVVEASREYGVNITSIHPFTSGFEYMMFFSAYKKRARESAEFYRRFFHAAAYLGAKYTVFHGDATKAPFFGMDNYCEVLELLMRTAKSEGCTLAHENVSTARGGNPIFMRELRDRFGKGNISFVLDIKQVVRGGYDPFDMIDAMGSDIAHVHINDYSELGCRLPFAGKLELEAIISKIEAHGYDGKYIIEVYHGDFEDDADIIRCAAKLENANVITAR